MKSTKEKIIESMYSILTEQGYENTSLREVGEKISIRKASIYYYFKTKEEIFLEVIDTYFKSVYEEKFKELEAVKTKEEYESNFLDFGKDIIKALGKNSRERKFFSEISIQSERIPSVKESIEEFEKMFEEGIKAYLHYGILINALPKDFKIEETAQLIMITIEGMMKKTYVAKNFDLDKVWAFFVDRVLAN